MHHNRHFFFHTKALIFRLFLIVIATILPVLLAGFLFLSWSKAQIQKEIKASAQATNHYMTENFCAELYDLSSQLNRLSNMNQFTAFFINQNTLTPSRYYTSLLEQRSLIKSYPDYYPIIADVIICYPDSAIALSAAQGLITDQKLISEEMITAIQSSPSILKEYDSTFFLGTIYPVSSIYRTGTPQHVFVMQLSEKYIADFLNTFSQHQHTIMYHNASKSSIASSAINDVTGTDAYFQYIENHIAEFPEESSFSWSDTDNYIVAEYAPFLDCTFIQVIPLNELFAVPNRIGFILMSYSFIALLSVFLFCFFSTRLFHRPINSLLEGYESLESSNFSVRIPENNSTLEFSQLIRGFNKMASHLHESVEKLYKYEIYTQKMELKQLQMQMNPHFLYNTYFILHRLIQQEDMEQASQLSSYLGNYFQYVTRNAKDLVPLSQEWKHAQDYLQIQAIRFSTRITCRVDSLPEAYHSLPVPRLILQPLLENALEHGLKDIMENGQVRMQFLEKENSIEIQISDNGSHLSDTQISDLNAAIHTTVSSEKEFTALHNIHKRLQLIYSDRAELELTPHFPCGLCVHIRIPCDQISSRCQ